MPVRVAIIFHSLHRHVFELAEAIAAGVREVPACQPYVARVLETLPAALIAAMGAADDVQQFSHVPLASLDDFDAADALLLGAPTYYGKMSGQMAAFLDSTGPLWVRGALVGKIGGAFTATGSQHGGGEATLGSLHTFMLQHGMLIAGIPTNPAYPDLLQTHEVSGGTPYGASSVAGEGRAMHGVSARELAIARLQGRHCATLARDLQAGRAQHA